MRLLACLLGFFLFSPAYATNNPDAATLIFTNGNIYTANDQQPRAQAVAVKNDRIIAVGSNDAMRKYQDADTRIIDLHNATMLPGLTDAHYHFIRVGFREMTFNLENTISIDDLLAKLKTRVSQTKSGEWITGNGWIETFWKPSRFPTRADLDRVSPDNPVILIRADLHAAVANTAALKIAGITKATKDPFGGRILHDKETGEPDGMLIDEAEAMVSSHIPAATDAATEQAMLIANKISIQHGLTQVQEPLGTYNDIKLYQKLYGEGKLKIRIYKAVSGPGVEADKLLLDGPIIEAYNHHFNLRAIKVVSDGALGSRGASLLEPYNDAHGNSGFMTVDEQAYYTMLTSALRQGIQVQTHAIGDAANRFTLNEYEKALNAIPADQRKNSDPRWRIEHSQIINAADIPRFAKLGIIPSMQPSHAISDLHYAAKRLGIKRLNGAYAWHSLLATGVIIPGGSDAPVEVGDPMIEFYAAIARKDTNGFSNKDWHHEQAVSRTQALKMFTLWPAYAAFEENLRGSIESGKLADFTVLSADIMKIPEKNILKTHCLMTVIGGEIVYEKESIT